jgi:hypothetical protein
MPEASSLEKFVIVDISVICPECEYPFATPSLLSMPNPDRNTPVEADLHRVLPHPSVRGALIAMCPSCRYAWWLAAFRPHNYLPVLLVPTPEVGFSKKFGFAMLEGRKHNETMLDLALLALNGAWCAREEVEAGLGEHKEVQRWLKLAARELEAAMSDTSWRGNTARYTYILAEILRQMGDFANAANRLQSVDSSCLLPRELIDHQLAMCNAGTAEPTLLPPHLVEEIFKLRPIVEDAYSEPQIPYVPSEEEIQALLKEIENPTPMAR